jgi:SNF2 family DNA or RNA helicase
MTIIDPKNRNKSWNQFIKGEPGLFFCHWDVLRLLIKEPEFLKQPWAHVIADECHRAQNRKSQQTRALKKLKVGAKTGLSGTPITGYAEKYWSILNWMYPKDFTSYWRFFEEYVDYIELVGPNGPYKKILGNKNTKELVALVAPYYVRHLKKEQCCEHHPQGVMPWLPDKYWSEEIVELGPQQRRAYDEMNKNMLAWVGANEDKPIITNMAIAQLMRLQQFAVGYADVDQFNQVQLYEPSAKIDRIMEKLEDNPDSRVVIWSQFKQAIYLLKKRLDKANIDTMLYTGDNTKIRDTHVKRFSEGNGRVFAGTISAGGVGVDGLQNSCSTMFFIDRLWNPALNNQAEDRLWRDGQKNSVQIVDFIADKTLDRGKHQRLGKTWAEIKEVLGDR